VFIVKKRSEVVRFGLFLILAGLLVWFVLGRFERWRLSQEPEAEALPTGGPVVAVPVTAGDSLAPAAFTDGRDYFAEFRMERERTRGALGERLKELIDSPAASAEVRKQASEQYLKLTQATALESQAESMVKARGFEEVVVHLSAESAHVVVKGASISQQQFLQVVDVVSRITGVKSSAISVLARE